MIAAVVTILLALAGTDEPVPAGGVSLLRDACIATEMRRDNLKVVADERGWEGLLRVVQGREDLQRIEADPNWEDAYAAAEGRVIVSGRKDRQPFLSTCTVVVEAPETGWRSHVEALAVELHMSAGEAAIQGDVETQSWTSLDGWTLVSNFYPAEGALELMILR